MIGDIKEEINNSPIIGECAATGEPIRESEARIENPDGEIYTPETYPEPELEEKQGE